MIEFAAAAAANPGLSIPMLAATWERTKAFYRVVHRPEATPDALQENARENVRRQARELGADGWVVFLEDTSTLSWPGNDPIAGLGPVGSGDEGLQGFLLHSVLALGWSNARARVGDSARRPAVEILGLLDQQFIVRKQRPKGSKKESTEARRLRERESQRWWNSTTRIGPAPPGVRYVRVADREGDCYEYLAACLAAGHDVAVRLCQDRVVLAEGIEPERLLEFARSLPAVTTLSLELRTRGADAARTAELSVSAHRLRMQKSFHLRKETQLPQCLDLTIVRVFEAADPGGLEWLIATSLPVDTPEQAAEIVRLYASRWIIEEFHKVLKSGMGAERLQLADKDSLFAAVAILGVVATRVLALRECSRLEPDSPADCAGLSGEELHVLRASYAHNRKKQVTTVRDVALALGALGGHLGRKGDGMPGIKSLWRGLQTLTLLVEGYRIARGTGFG